MMRSEYHMDYPMSLRRVASGAVKVVLQFKQRTRA
jgi:hypothetical protein